MFFDALTLFYCGKSVDDRACEMEYDKLSAPLYASVIESVCRAQGCSPEVVVLPSVESTNTWLWNNKQTSPLVLCATEHQTLGRGRRGKTWHTPRLGLTFSLRLICVEQIAQLSGLSLLVGSVLCDQLREMGVPRAMVKWPNDILVDGAKLAGILVESSTAAVSESPASRMDVVTSDSHSGNQSVVDQTAKVKAGAGTTVVIGIGVNYRRGREASLIDQASIDLYEICGAQLPERCEIIGLVTARLAKVLAQSVPESLNKLSQNWPDYDAMSGCELTVESGTERVSGRAAGIDSSGALMVQTDEGMKSFISADISFGKIAE